MASINNSSNNKILDELVNEIRDKKKTQNDQKLKKIVATDKKLCKAAVPISTRGGAYRKLLKGDKIGLMNDNGKTIAYCRCSKTTSDENNYCHLHERTIKVNKSELKNFEEDILPKSKTDKLRWIPTIDDTYFENMGKRGTKKKNIDNTFVFANKTDPVLLVLIHKDAKLSTQLSLCATQLLKFNSYILPKNDEIGIENSKEKISVDKNNSGNHIDNFVSMMESLNSSGLNKSLKSEEEDSEEEDSDDEENFDEKNLKSAKESIINKLDTKNAEESDAEESNAEESDAEESAADESVVDAEEDEQVSCEEILTLKGETLLYNKISNIVYRLDEDGDGEEIGFLTEIKKKYSTIYFEENKTYYTVMTDLKHPNGNEYKRCSLTNKFFDKKLTYMGKLSQIEKNKYEFIFQK